MVSRFLRSSAAAVALALSTIYMTPVLSQVPIPLQEQIQIFDSLPAAQQQALLRELQGELPPAQREAILGMLQQRSVPAQGPGTVGIDPSAAVGPPGGQFDLRDLPPRFSAGDTLVMDFELGDAAADASTQEFQRRLADANPYELDSDGVLFLPGVRAIPLAGLNVGEAAVLIGADRALRPFDIELTRIPLSPVGLDALQRFGYDLFSGVPTTFAPATDIPVPVDYVIGPGDTINVQLFGNQNAEYFLTVSREGIVNFPEIGPLNVSGISFADVRNTINERVAEQLIGVRASTTLGELRSIRVFLLGDVERPGSYTVSSLSTMTNALFAGGGVKTIGSLRKVALMRAGDTQTTLDLYDLLLRGDTSGDARLQPGDVIFVPPVGPTVAISGELRRPAIYELNGELTIAEVVALGGGLMANANRSSVKLERIVAGRGTTARDIDLGTAAGAQEAIQDGDVVRVQANLALLENSVRLEGNVHQPGLYQWYPSMRLSDLLPASEFVKPFSDLNYVLIRREAQPNVDIDVLSADLAAAWASRSGAADVELQARDTVFVFNFENGRQHIVAPILDELEAQASPSEALPIVRIGGRVRAGGGYPLEPGMRVSDLLRAGGGLSEAAYGIEAELTRYTVVNGEYREAELIAVDLAALLRGDTAADVLVAAYDYLNIKELPQWRELQSVSIFGEVVFPGAYPIRQGETLSSVLERAGGVTAYAFPQGSIFTRVELQEREREQLANLAIRMEADLASLSLGVSGGAEEISTGRSLLGQLRESVVTGRLVIQIEDLIAGREGADVVLKHGDQLIIPNVRQEVSVFGEVQYSTSHFYEPALGMDDYIQRSGGFTQRSDRRRTYVVRANGEVVASGNGRWFRRSGSADIRAGDTIVVPINLDRPLTRWSAITQIVYNLAIAAAAVSSF